MPEQIKKELLNNFLVYILNTNNINTLDYSNISSIRNNIKYTLKVLNSKNYDVYSIRRRREEINQDIKDVYSSFVGGDGFEPREEGKNTGLRPDSTELKHIKIRLLKEELEQLTKKTFLIEESLKANRELISNVFDVFLDETKATIMKSFYLDCLSNRTIANEYLYSIDGIKQSKSRAISTLAKLLIENQLKK